MIAPLYCCNKYKVDSNGFILSKRNGKPMKPSKNHNGYWATTLMINGERFTLPIHLAVARTFLGDKTKDGLEVNHKDGNKNNNNVDNLEWVTHKENMMHSAEVIGNCIGDKNANARPIKGYDKNTRELIYSFNSLSDCAKFFCNNNKDYKNTKTSIWRALNSLRKTYKNCIWEYSD